MPNDTPFCGGRWTEAQYRAFVRRGIRSLFSRWGPKYDALEAARRPSQRSDKRIKWEYQCVFCLRWFLRRQVEVDHIDEPGQYEDLNMYAGKMLCEIDGLQVACILCHAAKTEHRRAALKS